ncbi:MAG: tetratricopeptide repeat protein [Candidatus Poribacteria bacterium]|nr:tetratricopeptide repeat protein [Candidatus Poribacteria bacterium]
MLRYIQLASIATIACLILSGCAGSRDATQTEAYNRFAIKAAQAQLWNEAVFRWKQVINIDPEDSKAHNNLGVAYEALGNIDEAIASYQRAAELEPNNKYYRLNYRRCRIHLRRSGGGDGDAPQLEDEEEPPATE